MNDVVRDKKLQELREPFPADRIGSLPRGGKSLAYVGHADVTDRLLSVDPTWYWEPVALDEQGLPLFSRVNGKPVGLWIKLTVCQMARLGYGSVAPNAFDAEKQLIGDAIRNAAMRFGVALDLWRKEEGNQVEKPEGELQRIPEPEAKPETPRPTGPLCPICEADGMVSYSGKAAKLWRMENNQERCNGFLGLDPKTGEKMHANHTPADIEEWQRENS